jgi:hypothetical protein
MKEIVMDAKSPDALPADRKVSRRWVLRTAAAVPIGVAAASSLGNTDIDAGVTGTSSPAPDYDSATGEIFDRDRHHHWDTV